jgi:CRP/FNR family cyclic AMP-dependent transcriptional regulator
MHACEKILTSSLGKDLSLDDCAVLSAIVTFKNLKQGEILFSADEATKTLYVILSGKIDVTKNVSPDEWTLIHTLHEGDMAGEMSFIDGDTHSLTLRANTDTELFCLENAPFEGLLLTHPHLVYHVMRAITRTTHQALRRMNNQYLELNKFITNQYMG